MSTTLNSSRQALESVEQQGHEPSAALRSPLCAHASTVRLASSTAARRRALFVFAGLTTMFVVAALWRPADEPALVLCPFRALTHYPCPGCGMTRAFCALAHFEFWRAIKFNALSPLLFLSAIFAWASAAAILFRAERVRDALARLPRPTPLATKFMLAFVILWWLARLAGGF